LTFHFIVPSICIFGLVIVFRHELFKLFGPVLFYELIRVTRQRRTIAARAVYALLLGILFGFNYFVLIDEYGVNQERILPLHAQAELATNFFYTYSITQFVLVSFLTPALIAGSIAEEKERKTLEFLLATDLRNREIVFGKLAARVGSVMLFLASGLPVLSLVQFFGGIDPDQLLAVFAATVVAVLSLAALSILCSVNHRRALHAIVFAYFVAFSYIVMSLLVMGLGFLPEAKQAFTFMNTTVSLADVCYAFSIGNPIVGLIQLESSQGNVNVLVDTLEHFALFHAAFAGCCLIWSVLRLRAIALRQSYGAVGGRAIARTVRDRPDIGDFPMFWKEVFVESGMKMNFLGRLFTYSIFTISIAPVIVSWSVIFLDRNLRLTVPLGSPSAWRDFSMFVNGWVRLAGTVVACLLLIATALRGAGSIRGENDRQLLDNLLTTPLTTKKILWGKWWGCMLGLRKGWAWLGLIWLIGMATGGIHLAALPQMVISMAVFMSAYAWIGIWFSVNAGTSFRATIYTLLTGVFFGGGYVVVFGLCCMFPLEMTGTSSRALRDITEFIVGFAPPTIVSFMPMREFSDRELSWIDRNGSFVGNAVVGVLFWAAASIFLSRSCLRRFRVMTNRFAANSDSEFPLNREGKSYESRRMD
jgi:ABC-type transport system involved in multi-copper enzyme maturation permease subunit